MYEVVHAGLGSWSIRSAVASSNARLPIFQEDSDKKLLLDRMVHFAEIFRVEIRAYCLMINHVHVHLRTQGRYKNYRHAVESSLLVDITDLSEQAAAEAVLGSEGFIDRMRRAMNDVKENVNVRRESTQQRRLRSWRSLDEVIRAVESAYGISEKELRRKSNRGCEARQILLYLAAVHCRGRYALSEIAEQLAPLTISGLDSARSKMAAKLRKDKQLRERASQIERSLGKNADKSKSED